MTDIRSHHKNSRPLQYRLTLINRSRPIDQPNGIVSEAQIARQFLPTANLIFHQRPERIKHDHAVRRIFQDLMQGQGLENKALPRSGPGRHDHIFATAQHFQRQRLVRPHARFAQPLPEVGANPVFEQERRDRRVAGRLGRDVEGLDDGERTFPKDAPHRFVHY